MRERIENPYKNNRMEEITRKRNGVIIDILTSVAIVETAKYVGVVLEIYEGVFFDNLEKDPYTEIVTDMFEKRETFISQGKDLLQNVAKLKRSYYQFMVALLEKI